MNLCNTDHCCDGDADYDFKEIFHFLSFPTAPPARKLNQPFGVFDAQKVQQYQWLGTCVWDSESFYHIVIWSALSRTWNVFEIWVVYAFVPWWPPVILNIPRYHLVKLTICKIYTVDFCFVCILHATFCPNQHVLPVFWTIIMYYFWPESKYVSSPQACLRRYGSPTCKHSLPPRGLWDCHKWDVQISVSVCVGASFPVTNALTSSQWKAQASWLGCCKPTATFLSDGKLGKAWLMVSYWPLIPTSHWDTLEWAGQWWRETGPPEHNHGYASNNGSFHVIVFGWTWYCSPALSHQTIFTLD